MNPMNSNSSNPDQQPETEWHGELQEFSGKAMPPNDASLEPRVRRGRPVEAKRVASRENDADNEVRPQTE
jgi:hypothetical protein